MRSFPDAVRGGRLAATSALLVATLAGCATWQEPLDTSDALLRERAIAASSRGIEIRAAVLGPEDSRRMLGTDVTASGVQPVWIEVRNGTDDTLWMLRSGTDPDYFSPLEVAWYQHSKLRRRGNDAIDAHFDRMAFANPVPPGQTRSGLLYTTPQPVTRLLNVDLWGNRKLVPFSLLLDVPGYENFRSTRRLLAAPDEPVTDFTDLQELRQALEALPHTVTTANGSGGPLNLVLIGSIEDIAAAGARRGYRRDVTAADAALEVFGRAPDYASRKRINDDAATIWVRAWRAPVSFQGKPVLVAQAARAVGGRFASAADGSRMSPDVDEVRNVFLQSYMYSGGLEAVGFLAPVDAVPREAPRALADGSHYFTDGIRAVLFFSTRPLTFADVRRLDWEPFLERAEASPRTDSAR